MSLTERGSTKQGRHKPQMPIDVLLDDNVLLALFDFCLDEHTMTRIETLQSVVYACQRWGGVVFGSPRHLYFYLLCTPKTLPSFTRLLASQNADILILWAYATNHMESSL